MKPIVFILLVVLVVLLAANFQSLYLSYAVARAWQRLAASNPAVGAHANPPAMSDSPDGALAPLWRFSLINGAGQVSSDDTFHAASHTVQDGLRLLSLHPDPDFPAENGDMWARPAAGRYNNVAFVSRGGWLPTAQADIVITFYARVNPGFYGTAGLVIQPEGTLSEQGLFVDSFDMAGVTFVGPESSLQGHHGALLNLSLGWAPARTLPITGADMFRAAQYELRIRRVDARAWRVSVAVDGQAAGALDMPPFGPFEIQVWSDNYRLEYARPTWLHLAPLQSVSYQDGGEKTFIIGALQVGEAARP